MTNEVDTAQPPKGFWRRLGDTLLLAGASLEMSELEFLDLRVRALEKEARERRDAAGVVAVEG